MLEEKLEKSNSIKESVILAASEFVWEINNE